MTHETRKSGGGLYYWRTVILTAVLALILLASALLVTRGSLAAGPTSPARIAADAPHGVSIILPGRTAQLEADSGVSTAAIRSAMALAKLSARLVVERQPLLLLGLGLLMAYGAGGAAMILLAAYALLVARPARMQIARPLTRRAAKRERRGGLMSIQSRWGW